MAKPRKPRKAKKPNKSIIDKGVSIGNLGLIYLQGLPNVITFNIDTLKLVPVVSNKLSNEIYHEMHKWNFLIACLCSEDGENYFTQAHVTVSEPVLFDDLGYTLADYHLQLKNHTSDKGYKRMAWIAVPDDTEFNDEAVYRMFNRFQGFSDKMYGLWG